jgi:hypothetical protein
METYSVLDLDAYADSIRSAAASSLCENYTENLDDFITINQVKDIISNHIVGIDENDRYIVDEDSFNDTFEEVSIWLHEVGLAKLAAAGKLECAWDDESGEMIFWMPQNKGNNTEVSNNEHQPNNRTKSGDRQD